MIKAYELRTLSGQLVLRDVPQAFILSLATSTVKHLYTNETWPLDRFQLVMVYK